MGDTIEQTIYRLELDGSAYIDGVDKAAASTKKYSEAQEKANAKLAELQKSHNNYKKALDETNAVIKANEKETLELTKQLNALKESEKGASAEATRLKNELRGIATNTKEFKIEAAALKENLAQTTNQLKIQTKEVQAAEKAGGNFTQSLSKTYGGLSRIAQLIPGLGIGGLVAIISGPLISAFTEWFNSINKASDAIKLLKLNQEDLNEITANANKDAGKQTADLKILYEAATNVNLSMKDRLAAVKGLQQEFPDYFANIKAETILNGDAEAQYKALALSIQSVSRAKAAKEKLDVLEAQLLDKDFERQKVINATNRELARAKGTTGTGTGVVGGLGVTGGLGTSAEDVKQTIKNRRDLRLAEINADAKTLQDRIDFIIKFAGLANLANVIEEDAGKKGKGKVEKQRKEIVNIYEQELQKLRADIAKLEEKGFTTEASITKAIEEDFKIRSAAFDKALKKGQLTPGQLTDLKSKLDDLKKLVLAESIKSLNEQRAALLQKIDTDLSSIETEAATKRIANIQDNFERQSQAIIAGSEKLIKDRQKTTDKQIAEIKKSKLLTPEEISEAVLNVSAATAEFISQVKIQTSQQLQQLSFDTFEKLSEDLQRSLKDRNFDISALALIDIKKQNELLAQGKISYEQYQKALTQIAKEESDKRRENEIANLRIEVGRRQAELRSNRELTEEQSVRLLDEIRSREAQIDTLERGDKPDAPTQKRVETVQQYAQAIGAVVDSIILFWQKANEAESRSLDRSISLQEKRVSAAQRIAERGNAQYLKAEEDKLTELNVKRENAARRQLGIDAALQASQILVGVTGAIAKIATPGIGIAETIAAMAVIFGSLAAGYGLVKSLQGNQPTFFVGTKDTGPGGNKDSKGGFTATLHPNEAIIPADRNKAYKPAVEAIYDKTIPAETLNNFVKHYHQIKAVPQPNYSRIKEAAELHIGQDGRMSVLLSEHSNLLKENNELQRAILRKKGVHAELNVDKNGVGMMVTEYMEELRISKNK